MVEELGHLWHILDPHDLKGTTASWLKSVRPVVERGYLTSQYVAAEFVKASHNAALPGAPDLTVEIPNPLGAFGFHVQSDRKTQLRIAVSMKVTGPVTVANDSKPGMSKIQIHELMQNGLNKSSGAAVRLALNGGRGMVRMLAEADDSIKGVQSVAEDDACKSCRFLAETPLFKGVHTPKQLDAVAVGHDHCLCSVKPIF
ncbi:MAG: hypothetical protein ACKODT_08020 [Fluviibacter sp.]